MNNNKFCHLHVHDQYSQLDGFGTAKDYIKKAKLLGFNYIGLTNHGNIDGLIKWQKECDKQGIQPVLGCEAYIVKDALIKDKHEKRLHITILIKNQKGFKTLCNLLTIANTQGFYYKPRLDFNTFINADISNFVIMTACAGGLLSNVEGRNFFLKNLIGKTDLYLEIMPHDIKQQHEMHNIIQDLRKKSNLDLPLITTNDCHYIHKNEWKAQEVLLAIQRKAKWDDPNRWKFGFKGLHLRTADEMLEAFEPFINEHQEFTKPEIYVAMRNTLKVAKMCCEFRIPKQDISLPTPSEFKDENPDQFLEELIYENLYALLDHQYINEIQYDDYRHRVEFELQIIKEKKFSLYFLIVYELINWCKQPKNNIMVGPGRGSVGGSLVAYLLGITSIDPIEYGLLFERFIAIDRDDYPDIDLDFEDNKCDRVKAHLEKNYGYKNIASVSTFDTMQSRGVIRDVARVFDIPYKEVDDFAKAINVYDVEADKSPIQTCVDKTQVGDLFYRKHRDIVQLALQLEGQIRNSSQHAAAIIVSKEDLSNGKRCNLCMRSGQAVVNWDKDDAEYVGLMKLDVLKLKTLTVLNETKRLVKENHNKELIFENINLKDEKIFSEINKGNTVGMFQLNQKPSMELSKQIEVRNFEDIAVILALVRPGPADSGMKDEYIKRKKALLKGKRWKAKHQIYEKITEQTCGILVYQEQVMKVISEVAGLPFATANKIRKIIGKKRDPKEFQKYWEIFLEGCLTKRTMDEKEAEEFWEGLQKWAGYGFNKSHSIGYALLSYWTAYCKIYYPAEYICASLTYGPKSNIDPLMQEIFKMGLKIIPPKIGISDSHVWIAKDNKLFIPFAFIKGIGDKQAVLLMNEKTKQQKKFGFFNSPSEVQVPVAKPGSALDKILQDIGAYDLNGYPETAQQYFDFDITQKKHKRRI